METKNKETLDKRLTLRINQGVYDYHFRQAVKDGRNFNNYMSNLLSNLMPKKRPLSLSSVKD